MNGKEQDVINDEPITEIKTECSENDDVFLHTEDDPLAIDTSTSESTGIINIENIIQMLGQNIESNNTGHIEAKKVDDKIDLDTWQIQFDNEAPVQNIINIKDVSSSQMEKKDDSINASVQKKKEDNIESEKQKKEDNLNYSGQATKHLKTDKNVERVPAKHDINSKVSVHNIIDTERFRRRKYDVVYTESKDLNETEINNKNCDNNISGNNDKHPRHSEKERRKSIEQRRNCVVYKDKLKTELEGNKSSERRKSIDNSQNKKRDEINKEIPKQNDKEKLVNIDKQCSPNSQNYIKNMVPVRNKDQVVKSSDNNKIAAAINTLIEHDPKNIITKDAKKYRDNTIQDMFMGSSTSKNLNIMKNRDTVRDKPITKIHKINTLFDPVQENLLQNKIDSDKNKLRKTDEAHKINLKEIKIGGGESKNSSLDKKKGSNKKVSFHPDLVINRQKCTKVAKNDSKQNKVDNNQNKGSEGNKNITDFPSKGLGENNMDDVNDNQQPSLLDNIKTKEPITKKNNDVDKEGSKSEKVNNSVSSCRRKLLDDLKYKASGEKNKYDLNEKSIENIECDSKSDSKSCKRTLLDDLKTKCSKKMEKTCEIFNPDSGVDNRAPRRKLLDDLKNKKDREKTAVTNVLENNQDYVENRVPRRKLLDDLKNKSKEKNKNDIFGQYSPLGGEDDRTKVISDLKGKDQDKEKDSICDENLTVRKNNNLKQYKPKRVTFENKESGCELFHEPKTKNSRENKKTDTSDKRFKQTKESVEKQKNDDNDKYSKHRRDKSVNKKYSERHVDSGKDKNSRGGKKSTSDKHPDTVKNDNNFVNKDLADCKSSTRKEKSNINPEVKKIGNIENANNDVNKKAIKRTIEEKTEDMYDQNYSGGKKDLNPTSAKRKKSNNEIEGKEDSSRSKFDDLFHNISEETNKDHNLKGKVYKALLESDDEDEPNKAKKRPPKPQTEFQKHVDNIKMIMRWSNATPIRRFEGIGYECAFCEVQFHKPADLKNHTLEYHHGASNAYFIKKVDMPNYFVKLDITDLKCYLCSDKINNVEDLIDHLLIDHEKKMHRDIKNHIVPFKFDSNDLDTLSCFMCSSTHSKFKMLLEHTITTHFRNYICQVCSTGFVNVRKLQYHLRIHDKGTFECDYCENKYDTLTKKKAHEKSHRQGNARCAHCREPFIDYESKQRHLAEVHGVELPRIICNACDRVFTSRLHYGVHVKRDHLMQRNYECTECNMKFFKSSELRYHMLKHTSAKEFQCDVCYRMYTRKAYLTQHMRKHNDDRRFTCERCGKRFLQKSSWRKHMKDVHQEDNV